MTVAVGDIVTPAAIVPYASGTGVANLAAGLMVDKPIFGRVADIAAAPEMAVDWNNGSPSALGTSDYTTRNDALRFVEEAAAATVTAFRGRMVQLESPASQEFSGLVVAVFALEIGSIGKAADGATVTTEVVLFRTRAGEYVLAAATDVAVVSGQ